MISPDGARIAFVQDSELITATLDGGGRTRVTVVANPTVGEWLADGRLMLMDLDGLRVRWFEVDPSTGRPGTPEPWFTDVRFADTPGESFISAGDRTIIYKQSPSEAANHLRVIPGWVEQMKRAVDEADR